ncbi:MAG TPA: YihY/virulence factor BrkB family protein [Gaiellaceae bacterium]|nr:YihY/virulence factor BrkB family protein [Gaiellaceae bacterium]
MGARAAYDRFDAFQRRHRVLGFVLAVRQKYSDDQGGYLAATITYYGFFSIFPLLLVFVSVLGYALGSHSHLRRTILNSALGQFPVIGHDLQVRALSGNAVALALGGAAALWSGMGVFLAAENAMNHLWGVPFRRRPDFFRARARALGLLVVLGGGVLASTALGSAATFGAAYGLAWKILGIVLSVVVQFFLFWAGFRLLTTHDVGWRCLRGGAAAAAVAYAGLQLVGGYYVGHVLRHTTNTYGVFGLVIGLLSWIYLAVHITLLAAEGNVVATRHLWPRSFSIVFEEPASAADKRALTQRARVEERRSDEEIDVSFRD